MRSLAETVAKGFRESPGDASVLYYVAVLHARANHVMEAMAALRAMVATGAGLHPRDRDFGAVANEPEYKALVAEIKRQNSPVSNARVAFKIPDGSLAPEGIAFSARTKQIYFGSQRKITAASLDGTLHTFAAPAIGGLITTLGLRVDEKRGELWAVSNSIGPVPEGGVIGIFRFRLRDGALIRVYPIPTGKEDLLNDLAVAPDGTVYVTASDARLVYRLHPDSGAIEKWLTDLPDPNGITITPDGKYLFVAGWYTIIRINVATGEMMHLHKPPSIADGCFDGLYWAGDRELVGIQNCVHDSGRVMRLKLNPALDTVERAEVLELYNPRFDGITTAAIAGTDLYFVANVQFHKLDKDGKPTEPLDPLIMLRLSLKHKKQ